MEHRNFARQWVTLPDGLRMAYMESGETRRGKAPVVWIHGMGAYRETFHPLFAEPPVAARHIAPDLPGFGDSGHWRHRHQLADYVRAMVQFLDALGIEQAMLVGHSFGGMIAGETLIHHPERVRGVILVSSAGWFFPENALQPTPWVFVNRIGIWITGMHWFGRRMMAALGVDASRIDAEDQRRFQWGWRHAYEMARMGTFYDSPDFADRVVAAGKPIAAIHGTRDRLFPLARVRDIIGDRLPLWPIGGAGHVPFFSHPDAFKSAFRDAFESLAASPHNDSR